jgi:glycosyltransferase involved in cell wall biosynthesis
MLHIAHLAPPWIPVPPVTYGGTELMAAQLISGLQARGAKVRLYAAGDSTIKAPCFGPFAQSFWPPDKFSENLHLSYAFAHLNREPVDVVHSHLENAAGFWALGGIAAPLIITLHTPLTPIKCAYLQSFPKVKVAAVSQFQARQLDGHPGLHLIPHGLPLSAYPFGERREDFLLFLGRIYPDKGLHTAIRLALEMSQRLLIAGPVFEPDKPYFDQQIRPFLDGRRILYLGPADFGQKVRLLKKARALIFPLEVDEAFGLAMLEGMACGAPGLAYRRGAVPEVVAHGETGFVVDNFDGLKEALTQLHHLSPFACRERVARHFSRRRMVSAYLALYRRALE